MKPEAGIDRLPPQNLEAEQSVLGAILLDNEAIFKTVDIVSEIDFYREAHKRIYGAMSSLSEKNEPVDIITLTDHLKKTNELEAVGGISYLSQLASMVPTAANVRYHAKIVREKAVLRALIQASTNIAAMVYEESRDAGELVDMAEKMVFEISDSRNKNAFASMNSVIKESIKIIEKLHEQKEDITGMPTGFADLDALTSGFQPGDLIIIGGRPGMGKTAFALNIAQHVAVERSEPVAIFSLEMSKEQLAMRMLSSESRLDASLVRKGHIGKDKWPALTRAAQKLVEAPIFIDDSSALTSLEIRAKARRLSKEHKGIGLVVIDYLQLMRSRGNFERREQEISDISRSLKALAKELKVPVIALSQLNRQVEHRGEKRPTLADLRESGAIEQDADVIIFLYKDEAHQKGMGYHRDSKIIVDVAKQRNGPTDRINLTFLAKYTRFEAYTEMESVEAEEEVF
ncbi:MAG: replicative DNA helicase [Nitrospirae bacterium]|nr:replicative DNA helicase [Nitrospirota bacterium]